MPSPTTSLSTLRPDLGGSLAEFDLAMNESGFIGLNVMPVFEAAKQAGQFGRIPLKALLQQPETRRSPGAGYNVRTWQWEPDSYATVEHGIAEPVDDREAEMYADYFDAELESAAIARADVLGGFERRVADLIQDTGTFANAAIGGTAWTQANVSTADPISDVETAVQAVWGACGLWPNAIVMTRPVFRNLRLIESVIDKVKFVERVLPGDINVGHIAAAFDLPYVFVAGGVKNAANPGQAASVASIWNDDMVWIGRVATSGRIKEPCVGRTIHWSADGSSIGGTVESYRDENRRSDMIRVRMDTDEKLILPACGRLLTTVLTKS